MKIYSNWELKKQDENFYIPATVPGAVQVDWSKYNNMPDVNFGMNHQLYSELHDFSWQYRTPIDNIETNGENVYFVSEGIDYEFEILIDGEKIFYQEGMFTPVKIDITKYVNKNKYLEVLVYKAPRDTNAPKNTRAEAVQSIKPPSSYGWDWHPYLIPLGIWDDTYFLTERQSIETDVEYTLSDDLKKVTVNLKSNLDVDWELYSPCGKLIASEKGSDCTVEIDNPKLWWCVGYGEANLYKWVAKYDGEIVKEKTIGFRKVALVMSEGSWDNNDAFPKSRNTPPIQLNLNGINVFAKGSNWVTPEIFYANITKETYENQLNLVLEANMNILRIWGGCIVNKDSFYQLCDEKGILIWQEFTLACNLYPDHDVYLAKLEQEATSIINKLKKHCSVCLWCGGNELFNNWSMMTDQSLPLRLLNKLCYDLDKHTPFIPASPLMGMAHGGYTFHYPNGETVQTIMNKASNTAYTEFGVPSISSVETLKMVADEKDLFPFEKNEITTAHHAFGAWPVFRDTWSGIDTIEYYFGKANSLDELVQNSQLLQNEGYKYIFEEARRQKPLCSMAINWCLNEPWPSVANNNIISYPCTPKPALYAIKNALKPVVATARFDKFSYTSNEVFQAELFMLNDKLQNTPAGTVKVFIEIDDKEHFVLDWEFDELTNAENQMGPIIRYKLPVIDTKEFKLILNCGEFSSVYTFNYKYKAPKIKKKLADMNSSN